MSSNSPANHVISANAHNLWWLPTLLAGRWIDDWEPLIGALSFRWAGFALVGLVLLACVRRLRGRAPSPDYYLLAAALGVGWFLFTPRAHEYPALALARGRPRPGLARGRNRVKPAAPAPGPVAATASGVVPVSRPAGR